MKRTIVPVRRPSLLVLLAALAASLHAVAPPVAGAADGKVEARAGADAGTTTRAPSANRGRHLFMTVGCVHCHGGAGQGSNSGTRLAPEPLPAEAIAAFIRATNTQMPAYSAEVLSDADVADIAAYLRTIKPSKSADDIPTLRALRPVP